MATPSLQSLDTRILTGVVAGDTFRRKLKIASSAESLFISYRSGVVWSRGVLGEGPNGDPFLAFTAAGLGMP